MHTAAIHLAGMNEHVFTPHYLSRINLQNTIPTFKWLFSQWFKVDRLNDVLPKEVVAVFLKQIVGYVWCDELFNDIYMKSLSFQFPVGLIRLVDKSVGLNAAHCGIMNK